MVKNYVSLNSNTTLGFNKKEEIASRIDSTTTKASWFFTIMVLLSLTVVQKATANHKTNLVITSSYTYQSVILESLVAQGQSGGGGHGNPDWVGWHQLDVKPLYKLSLIIHTNLYNIT